MGLCVESGDFRRPSTKPDVDFGKFTVQCADIPLVKLRKRSSKKGNEQQKDRRTNIRLTPISESSEELMEREQSFLSTKRENSLTPNKSEMGICSESLTLSLSTENSFERSDTPIGRRQCTKLLLDDCETVEDELGRICEVTGTTAANRDLFNILTRLPPRPRCRRKVLPPSLTNEGTVEKAKAKKLLKLRKRIESRLQSQSQSASPVKSLTPSTSMSRLDNISPLKDIRSKYSRLHDIPSKDDTRPKSADSDVRIIRLADLASGGNSASVPDLPSILSKLSDRSDSKRTSLDCDDNGALSTPRNAPEPPLTLAGWDKNCLKGSDMSSFYNMWERDRTKRPFGKKAKRKALVTRSCMCSLRKCVDRLHHERGKCLPPISSAQG